MSCRQCKNQRCCTNRIYGDGFYNKNSHLC